MKKWILGVAALVVLVTTAAFVFQQPVKAATKSDKADQGKEKKETVYNVSVVTVEPKEIKTYVDATSTLRPDRQVDIFSKVPGQITALPFEEGDRVELDQVIAHLDGESAQLELEQATVILQRATRDFERIKTTYKKELVSATEYDMKKFEYEKAQADFNLAAHRVSLTEIKAPFAGTVLQRHVELGQTIQASDRICTIANLTPLEADVFVPELRAEPIQAGQFVQLSGDEYFKSHFVGSVERVSPVVDRETGTVKVTIAVSEAPKNIRPGSYVHLRIVTDTVDALATVPKKALVFDSRQNASVFVVADEGESTRVQRVAVELGPEDAGIVTVSSGLTPGSKIVLNGKESLKDGSLVKET